MVIDYKNRKNSGVLRLFLNKLRSDFYTANITILLIIPNKKQ